MRPISKISKIGKRTLIRPWSGSRKRREPIPSGLLGLMCLNEYKIDTKIRVDQGTPQSEDIITCLFKGIERTGNLTSYNFLGREEEGTIVMYEVSAGKFRGLEEERVLAPTIFSIHRTKRGEKGYETLDRELKEKGIK